MLTILVTEPKEVAVGSILVSYSRKSTDKNPVAEADKYRAVVVTPAYKLPSAVYQEGEGESLTIKDAEDVFGEAIKEVFMAAASAILLDYCKNNPSSKEVSEEAFSFSAVLEKMEASQTSQRLNQEQIFAWYDASETKKEANIRYTDSDKGKKQQAGLREKFGAVASNNSGISPELAGKMLGYVSEKDTNNATCIAVCKKLERLTKVTVDADEL